MFFTRQPFLSLQWFNIRTISFNTYIFTLTACYLLVPRWWEATEPSWLTLIIIPTIHNTKSLWCLSFAHFYCSYSCFLTCIPLAFHILQNEIFPKACFCFILFYFFFCSLLTWLLLYAFLSLLIPTVHRNSPGIVSVCARLDCKQKKKKQEKKIKQKILTLLHARIICTFVYIWKCCCIKHKINNSRMV